MKVHKKEYEKLIRKQGDGHEAKEKKNWSNSINDRADFIYDSYWMLLQIEFFRERE
jgi:hypothetical protein